MEKAVFVREWTSGSGAHQKLYRLETPYMWDADDDENLHCVSHVVVSALSSAFDTGRPEAYIFEADENGKVLDWLDMPGSLRGTTDHAKALAGLGYTVESTELA